MRKIDVFTPIEEAFRILASSMELAPKAEEVDVEGSYGRVLAENLSSPIDIPATHISHVDGFAVRSQDVGKASREAPVILKVKGVIGPGERVIGEVRPGEAYRVLTGGAIPVGADAVVMQEFTEYLGDVVKVFAAVEPWENVDEAGGDVKKGEPIFREGHVIRSQDISFLMNLGFRRLRVYWRPVVCVMSVGSELTDKPDKARAGKVLNTHRYMVERLVESAGARPVYGGLIRDDVEEIESALHRALKSSDIVLVIGGSSVSERDFVAEALGRLGAKPLLQGLRIQPGRVGGFGVVGGKPVIMLPGLIISTINVYVFLVYPLIRKLLGLNPRPYSWKTRARLISPVEFNPKYRGFKRIVWMKLERRGGELYAEPRGGPSSRYSIVVKADGYSVFPEGVERVEVGEEVEVRFVPGAASPEEI